MRTSSSDFIKRFDSRQNKIIRPFIIAEAGVNHEGSMEVAKKLIDLALEGGADAIKFQSYKAETLASKNSPAYWDTSLEKTTSQYQLFKKHDSFWKNEFEGLKRHCDNAGIEFMCTPFDIESATFLNDLLDSFKVSSSDLSNFPFIEYICSFGKPILLSTGASYMWEVHEVVELIDSHNIPLCLLHCILNYPTLDEHANLGMLLHLKQQFPNTILGYSDHTLPKDMEVLKTAVLLGASIIEKHFTHDKTLPGNDHYHAMDVEDLKLFNEKLDKTFEVLGAFEKNVLESEMISRKNARRSLVAQVDIPSGAVITREMLTWKRPAFGISPKKMDQVVGHKVKVDIEKDQLIYWEFLAHNEVK